MSIIKHGILAPFSGKTGPVIGTFWKGRNIYKTVQNVVYNPDTPAQQEQRLKYKLAKSFNSLNKELIRIGFSGIPGSATPDNRALKLNIKNAITGQFPDLSLDLHKVKLSSGYLENIQAPVVESAGTANIKIQWTDNSGNGRAMSSDQILISIMDSAGLEVFKPLKLIRRKDKECTIELPGSWSGKHVIILGFTIADTVYGKAASPNEISTSEVYGEVALN